MFHNIATIKRSREIGEKRGKNHFVVECGRP
jgi:hypothetical protein